MNHEKTKSLKNILNKHQNHFFCIEFKNDSSETIQGDYIKEGELGPNYKETSQNKFGKLT